MDDTIESFHKLISVGYIFGHCDRKVRAQLLYDHVAKHAIAVSRCVFGKRIYVIEAVREKSSNENRRNEPLVFSRLGDCADKTFKFNISCRITTPERGQLVREDNVNCDLLVVMSLTAPVLLLSEVGKTERST